MLAALLLLAVIFIAPFGLMYYLRYRRDKAIMRKISLDVKNELLKSGSYSDISDSTLRLVRSGVIGKSIATAIIYIAMIILYNIAAVFFMKAYIGDVIIVTLMSAALLLFYAASVFVSLIRLSRRDGLIKIKGFVCRKSNYEMLTVYYDMEKLRYRVHHCGLIFDKIHNAEPGRLVNLIAVRSRHRVRIIRILTF